MRIYKHYLIILTFLMTFTSFGQATTSTSPNIIFFVVDDLGYSDLGCYGSLFYETPAIDQLASEGIRFTNGYEAAPRCVESRTSIMSGMYNYRPENDYLNASQYTWAEALRDYGYATFFTGKWHLGHDENTENPEHQGFDVNIAGGHFGSPPSYFYPYQNSQEGQLPHVGTSRHSNYTGNPAAGDDEEYITDRLTWETIDWMTNHVNTNPAKPFVIELAHYGVHTPFEGKTSYVNYFQNKKDNTTYLGPDVVYELTGETKLKQDFPTYAAMIKSIDDSMAALRAKLVELGIENNTVIIMTSDNGGLSTIPIASGREVATSNKPLKTGKGWLYEGGIRIPMIVYGANYRHGVVEDTPVVGVDFYPTLMEIAGAPLQPTQHKDGLSFKNALTNSGYERSEPIIIDYNFAKVGTGNPSMGIVRDGNYKLVELKYNWQYELYDVVNDPGETNDISTENPLIVANLKSKLFQKRRDVGTSHEVENSGFLQTQREFYQTMNSVTGSNVQETEICGTPASNSIVRNGNFECFYDINWSAGVFGAGEGTLVDGAGSQYAGDHAVILRTTATDGAVAGTRIDNKVFDANVKGKTIVCSVYAKSPAIGAKFRFQLKTTDVNGISKTYNGSTFNLTNTYAEYTSTIALDAVDTQNVQLKIQGGAVVGDIYFDEVKATFLEDNVVMVNKDFENGHDVDWTFTGSGTAVATYNNAGANSRSGSSAAKIQVTTAGSSYGNAQITNTAYVPSTAITDDKLTISGYAKTLAGKPFRIKVNFTGAVSPTFLTTPNIATNTSYGLFSQDFIIPTGATGFTVQIQVGKNVDTYYFDDLDAVITSALDNKVVYSESLKITQENKILHINSPYEIYKVSMLDMTGKNVLTRWDVSDYINIAPLNPGVYVVEIEFEDGVKHKEKILIK